MGVTLDIDNRYVRIRGASRKAIRALEHITSYKVAGHQFSPAFRAGRWDGREHLLKYSDKNGYRAPIGLAEDIINVLDELGLEYDLDISRRRALRAKLNFGWNPEVELRPYQNDAITSVIKVRRLLRGLGILKLPIRSGKTWTAAGLIRRLGARTLFIVPSQMLLHQTRKALEKVLCTPVGIIGDSEWMEGDGATVATIQTLARVRGGTFICKGNFETDDDGKKHWPKDGEKCKCKKKKCEGEQKYRVPPTETYKAMRTTYDLIIFDECHHLRGDVWHKAMMDFDAPFRIGLSATAYLENERENERGVIWLKACCGGIRIDVPTSQLIEDGYLMRQNVELYVIDEPEDLHDRGWSQSLLNAAIYENEYRNGKVIEVAREKVASGLKVMIVSNRHNQIKLLLECANEYGDLNPITVTGPDSSKAREDKVQMFIDGEANVLIGTVFGEGVDIPEVECVINAEGGRDVKATVQRMRNLTVAEGKTKAVFVDFMDMTNSYFAEHSQERLATYRSESAFVIERVS